MNDKYELLINLIQGYPHLYDKSNKIFKDVQMRNRYGREKRSLPSGSEASITPKWEHLESMSFLNEYVKPRNTYTTTPVVVKKRNVITFPPSIFIDTSSIDLTDTPLDSSTVGDISMSPHSNTENGGHLIDDYVYEELEQVEKQAGTANCERVQLASKEKSKKRKLSESDTAKEALDAAKSITEHLKMLSQNQQPETSVDAWGEYIAKVLNEMTPEKQKIKRRKLVKV